MDVREVYSATMASFVSDNITLNQTDSSESRS